jgi:NAD(P)-dependent dehydrogenase (short-subunit alcohol dehydrogenase family)
MYAYMHTHPSLTSDLPVPSYPGIGRHAALHLADQGGFLVFAGVRRVEDGEALKANSEHPERIVPVILDVTKQDQIIAALATIRSELAARGGLSLVGLVNNAGVTGRADPVSRSIKAVLTWSPPTWIAWDWAN